MPRTVISLSPEDKEWLDRQARACGVPMTELVRQAVRAYRVREESAARPRLQATLQRTAGIGHFGDALAHQRRLRKEWEGRQ